MVALPRGRSASVLAPLVCVLLLGAGCSSGTAEPTPDATTSATPEPTASAAPVASAALVVESGTVRSRGCYRSTSPAGGSSDGRYLDYDISWRTDAPVVIDRVTLIDPVGVRLREPAEVVRTREPGAPVIDGAQLPDTAGALEDVVASSRLAFEDAAPAAGTELPAGKSGVFLLHLQYDITTPYSYGGLRVTYTPAQGGESVTVDAPADIAGRFTRRCAR